MKKNILFLAIAVLVSYQPKPKKEAKSTITAVTIEMFLSFGESSKFTLIPNKTELIIYEDWRISHSMVHLYQFDTAEDITIQE